MTPAQRRFLVGLGFVLLAVVAVRAVAILAQGHPAH